LSDYLTEQEQVELLKKWIKEYTPVVLAGFVIAMLAITGWRYWQQHQNNVLSHASSTYDEMIAMRAQNNATGTALQAQKLLTHYPKTPYGDMAALAQARTAALAANIKEAKQQLNFVIKHDHSKAIQQIARIRLARLWLFENKPQEALDTLNTVSDTTFNGLIDEVRGDAYVAMHDTNHAREAYGLALKELPNAETIRPLLKMKFDNLT
jgi:predicted negative regulator of RcsB-dependent stress response